MATIAGMLSVAFGRWSGMPEAEIGRVLEVPLGRLRGELRALARRRVVDLVVDVRDVVDERHVVAAQLQPRAQPHPEHERPRVADVRPLVDGRAAEVHPDRPGRRRQLLELPRERVVETHRPSRGPTQELVPRERVDHGRQLRAALAPRSARAAAPSDRPDRLQLADGGAAVEPALDQLAEAGQRLRRVAGTAGGSSTLRGVALPRRGRAPRAGPGRPRRARRRARQAPRQRARPCLEREPAQPR